MIAKRYENKGIGALPRTRPAQRSSHAPLSHWPHSHSDRRRLHRRRRSRRFVAAVAALSLNLRRWCPRATSGAARRPAARMPLHCVSAARMTLARPPSDCASAKCMTLARTPPDCASAIAHDSGMYAARLRIRHAHDSGTYAARLRIRHRGPLPTHPPSLPGPASATSQPPRLHHRKNRVGFAQPHPYDEQHHEYLP